MEFISSNALTIILAIIGLFVGIAITIRIRKNNTDNSNKAKQNNNMVGGDMAGRDINKKP